MQLEQQAEANNGRVECFHSAEPLARAPTLQRWQENNRHQSW